MARYGCSGAVVGEGTGSDREEDLRVVREGLRGQTPHVLITAEKVKVGSGLGDFGGGLLRTGYHVSNHMQ